jgi:phosphatidylethanolamine-binding protein (PEBP) family uncharacterized protein
MKHFIRIALTAALLVSSAGIVNSSAATAKLISFQAEGWADNWYSLYINGKKVGEDPVPITTTKSFNSTTIKFTASYPFTIGVVAKDYTENSSGLEYIGQPNQQIGDGGFILQIRDLSTGKVIASTNKSWKSLVINKAPSNPSCVTSKNPVIECKYSNISIPAAWASTTFNDSKWATAMEFTEAAVGVKEGYFDITWTPSAKLIWSTDLKLDNVILFRSTIKNAAQVTSSSTSENNRGNLTVTSSDISSSGVLDKSTTCDGAGTSPQVSWSGYPDATRSFYVTMDTVPGPPRPGEVVSPDHSYFNLYNIPSDVHSIASGNLSPGTVGQSFKNKKFGYEPPCSQGPGAKIYTISVYALSSVITIDSVNATQSAISSAIQGKILAQGKISATYSRP